MERKRISWQTKTQFFIPLQIIKTGEGENFVVGTVLKCEIENVVERNELKPPYVGEMKKEEEDEGNNFFIFSTNRFAAFTALV